MKKNIIKKQILALIIITTLALSVSLTVLMTVNAQTNPVSYFDTYCYVITIPNPVGVNQQTYIQFRIDKVSPTTQGEEGGDHFEGFTVDIQMPDGSSETFGPFNTDSTSGSWFIFYPTMVGDHKVQANFPGQWINGSQIIMGFPLPPVDRWYRPSESQELTLTVQEDPIEPWPDIPLPTGYWERPISAENKGWFRIADNWLMPSYDDPSRGFHWSPAYAPYTSAPDSPHVLWTKPFRFGGIVGGQFEDISYYTGLSYEEPLPNKLILNGRLIYTERTHGSDANGAYALGGGGFEYGRLGTRILDLYTGEEIMFLNNTVIDFAQTLLFDTANQHGVHPHLWQSIPGGYNVYDAFTGAKMFTINNVPGGTIRFGPKGEILKYALSNGILSCWNSTKAILTASQPRWGVTVREEYYNIPRGAQINGTLGVEWSVSVADVGVPLGISWINVKENVIIAAYDDSSSYPTTRTEAAYPAILQKDSSGNYPTSINHLWVTTRQDIEGAAYETYGTFSVNIDGGVYAAWDEGMVELYAYSAVTGEQLWSSGQIESEGLVTFSHNLIVAYDMVIISGYDGHVRAFDSQTGALEWDYYKGSAGYEVFFGTWPDYGGYTVADKKVYVSSDDHSPEGVLWRGASLWCVNATNGEELWKLPGMLRQSSIADGILVAGNSYDGLIYAIGKGPSELTVTAPDTGIPLGSSVMIKGTVKDMSPGSLETPAISDEHMGEWMGYLHQNKPRPENAVGVPVKIQIVDPAGTYAWIGTVTSDSYGNYAYSFIPQMKGTYTIIATFDGSNSYGGSISTTHLIVDPAPAPYPTYPGYQGPSAQEVANRVVANLPADATPQQVADAVVNAMPEYPEPQEVSIPEYTTFDIVMMVAIVAVVVLVVYAIYKVNKIK